VRIAPQDPIGARLEARHIAGYELRAYRNRAIVELKLYAACESQVHAHRRSTGNGPDTVGAAISRKHPPPRRIMHIHP
jgi:hypothetical protein